MENKKFRKEEKCVCCGDTSCDTCGCDELDKQIKEEMEIENEDN